MKKKRYVKPVIELVELEGDGFICLSYAVKGVEGEGDIIPPTVAGSVEWKENKDEGDGGGIWGDLD